MPNFRFFVLLFLLAAAIQDLNAQPVATTHTYGDTASPIAQNGDSKVGLSFNHDGTGGSDSGLDLTLTFGPADTDYTVAYSTANVTGANLSSSGDASLSFSITLLAARATKVRFETATTKFALNGFVIAYNGASDISMTVRGYDAFNTEVAATTPRAVTRQTAATFDATDLANMDMDWLEISAFEIEFSGEIGPFEIDDMEIGEATPVELLEFDID